MNNFNRTYKKNTNFVSRKVDDENILVPIRQNVGDMDNVYTMNEVGTFIWEQIDGKKDEKKIIEAVTEEFDVDISTANNDVVSFIKEIEDFIILVE